MKGLLIEKNEWVLRKQESKAGGYECEREEEEEEDEEEKADTLIWLSGLRPEFEA